MEYTSENHRKYVEEQGGCPATKGKTWCNGKAGHFGDHYAQRVPTPGIAIDENNPSQIWWI